MKIRSSSSSVQTSIFVLYYKKRFHSLRKAFFGTTLIEKVQILFQMNNFFANS